SQQSKPSSSAGSKRLSRATTVSNVVSHVKGDMTSVSNRSIDTNPPRVRSYGGAKQASSHRSRTHQKRASAQTPSTDTHTPQETPTDTPTPLHHQESTHVHLHTNTRTHAPTLAHSHSQPQTHMRNYGPLYDHEYTGTSLQRGDGVHEGGEDGGEPRPRTGTRTSTSTGTNTRTRTYGPSRSQTVSHNISPELGRDEREPSQNRMASVSINRTEAMDRGGSRSDGDGADGDPGVGEGSRSDSKNRSAANRRRGSRGTASQGMGRMSNRAVSVPDGLHQSDGRTSTRYHNSADPDSELTTTNMSRRLQPKRLSYSNTSLVRTTRTSQPSSIKPHSGVSDVDSFPR
ncbi:hypothetical protein SARC_13756, partial [Sphaeroforma arctica JP610]